MSTLQSVMGTGILWSWEAERPNRRWPAFRWFGSGNLELELGEPGIERCNDGFDRFELQPVPLVGNAQKLSTTDQAWRRETISLAFGPIGSFSPTVISAGHWMSRELWRERICVQALQHPGHMRDSLRIAR